MGMAQGRRGAASMSGDTVFGVSPGGTEAGWRGVVYHKHHTSARTVFLQIDGSVVVAASGEASAIGPHDGRIGIHPASGLAGLADLLSLPPSALRVDADPLRSGGEIAGPIWLVELASIDPPEAAAAAAGGRFVSLLEARLLDEAQRSLLGTAYTRILG